jgi:hypothetical protein
VEQSLRCSAPEYFICQKINREFRWRGFANRALLCKSKNTKRKNSIQNIVLRTKKAQISGFITRI